LLEIFTLLRYFPSY